MQDPFEKMFSNDYVVTGTWSDPTIERNGQPAAARGAQPSAGAGGAK